MLGGGCWPQAKSCSIAPTPALEHQGSAPACCEGWAGAAGPLGACGTLGGGALWHPIAMAGCSNNPCSVCPTGWAEPPHLTCCLSSRDGKVFQVLLGAHSLTEPEPHKRLYRVRAQIPHPGSNIHNNKDDLLLLQVGSGLPGPWLGLSFPLPDRHSPAPANPSAPRDPAGSLTAVGGNP